MPGSEAKVAKVLPGSPKVLSLWPSLGDAFAGFLAKIAEVLCGSPKWFSEAGRLPDFGIRLPRFSLVLSSGSYMQLTVTALVSSKFCIFTAQQDGWMEEGMDGVDLIICLAIWILYNVRVPMLCDEFRTIP